MTSWTDGDRCRPVRYTMATVTTLHDDVILLEPDLPHILDRKKKRGGRRSRSGTGFLRRCCGSLWGARVNGMNRELAVSRAIVNRADGGKPIWMQRHIRREREILASYLPARLVGYQWEPGGLPVTWYQGCSGYMTGG